MSDFSTNLQLPYLMPAQAQKHVTVNEGLRILDALCQANAVSMSIAAQPASPADGALYVIPAGKSGTDWSDAANWSLGLYADGAWTFIVPREGWLVWVKDAAKLMRWTGAAWTQVDIVTAGTVLTALANGGSLADPNADRILFWDDSENGYRHLAPSANLAITGATLDVASALTLAGITISGASNSSVNLLQSGATAQPLLVRTSSGSYAGTVQILRSNTSGGSAYKFWEAQSGNGADVEGYFRGDGQLVIDGTVTTGGADFAEMLEWADGNPDAEDRVGLSVVLENGRIRPATGADGSGDIIGAVSAKPTACGDAWDHRWSGKHLTDALGRPLMEDHEVATWTVPGALEGAAPVVHCYALDGLPEGVTVPQDATITTRRRRVLNPEYDTELEYIPRALRPEWDAVGLMGKLRLRAGQPVGPRWIKLRDISAQVEEWLVR